MTRAPASAAAMMAARHRAAVAVAGRVERGDREDRGLRCDAGHADRVEGAGNDAGHAGAMTVLLGGRGHLGEQVDLGQDTSGEVGVRSVDPGVDDGDDDAGALARGPGIGGSDHREVPLRRAQWLGVDRLEGAQSCGGGGDHPRLGVEVCSQVRGLGGRVRAQLGDRGRPRAVLHKDGDLVERRPQALIRLGHVLCRHRERDSLRETHRRGVCRGWGFGSGIVRRSRRHASKEGHGRDARDERAGEPGHGRLLAGWMRRSVTSMAAQGSERFPRVVRSG